MRQDGHGLYGLVNNAGIGEVGSLPTWTDEEMLEIFDVNVFGHHRVTNAFLDLLVESPGRIVNISSQGGVITPKHYGPYTMTKHTLEAYTSTLREELKPNGAGVRVTQPGLVESGIEDNSRPWSQTRFQRAGLLFEEEARNALQSFAELVSFNPDLPKPCSNRKASSPEIV